MSSESLQPITAQAELEAFCAELATQPYICVDTEFHRETTFWPQLCLIQAAGPDVEGIIDPLAEDLDIGPFLTLLAEESRVKVMHAARQDMEIFNRLIGHPPGPLFDTQIAAMALGLGDSISYDNLVNQMLGRQIDKSSQFTDWTRRPLSEKQLKYAMGDVTHLCEAYEKMLDRLKTLDRLNWVREEMTDQEDPALYDTNPKNAWQRLKMRRNKKDYLAVMAAVAEWREVAAQSLNRPRRRILKDDALQEIAEQRPRDAAGFERLRAVPNGFLKSRYGRGLLEAVTAALNDPDAYAPQLPPRPRNAQVPAGAPDMLKVLLKAVSDEAKVVPRLIANSADIDKIARGDTDDVAAYRGWRDELFGQKARALMSGKLALSFEGGQVRLFET